MQGPDPRSDERLIAATNAGDIAAFEALYERHKGFAMRVAMRFARDPELAADAVQETFLYLLGKFPGFELRSKLTTFLYPAIKHNAIAAARKARREAPAGDALPEASIEPLDPPGEGERRAELARVMGVLPPAQLEVMLMRFVDGMDNNTIALALGVPLGTVKTRIHHAVRTLREDPGTRAYFGIDEGAPADH
jgi:RNA polymerase sigma-70 factor (ECF subfamily)